MPKAEKKRLAATSTQSKKRNSAGSNENGKERKKGGIDEFDALFSEKKKLDRQTKEDEAKKEAARKAAKKARYKNELTSSSSSSKNWSTDAGGCEWVDDGLGGKYNKEGFTGRVEDGVKIFKRHILNKEGAGYTKDCPFDCNCCFI